MLGTNGIGGAAATIILNPIITGMMLLVAIFFQVAITSAHKHRKALQLV